jgi:hypothetical protein
MGHEVRVAEPKYFAGGDHPFFKRFTFCGAHYFLKYYSGSSVVTSLDKSDQILLEVILALVTPEDLVACTLRERRTTYQVIIRVKQRVRDVEGHSPYCSTCASSRPLETAYASLPSSFTIVFSI